MGQNDRLGLTKEKPWSLKQTPSQKLPPSGNASLIYLVLTLLWTAACNHSWRQNSRSDMALLFPQIHRKACRQEQWDHRQNPPARLEHTAPLPPLSCPTWSSCHSTDPPGWDNRWLCTPRCLSPSPQRSWTRLFQLRIATPTPRTPAYLYTYKYVFYLFIYYYFIYIFDTHTVYPKSSCHFEECSDRVKRAMCTKEHCCHRYKKKPECLLLCDFSGRKENLKASQWV